MRSRTGSMFWMSTILDCDGIGPTEKVLLMALADHVDDRDTCFVGLARVARRASVSYSTAKRRMVELEERGLVKRTRRRREGTGNLSTYDMTLQRSAFGLEPLVDDPVEILGTDESLGLNMSPSHGSPVVSGHGSPGEPAEETRFNSPEDKNPPTPLTVTEATVAITDMIRDIGGRRGLPTWDDDRMAALVAALGGWSLVCDLAVSVRDERIADLLRPKRRRKAG